PTRRSSDLRAFRFSQPKAKKLLLAFHVDSQSQVQGFIDDAFILSNFQNDAVQIDHGLDRIQRAVLPLVHLLANSRCHLRDERGRYIRVIHFLEGIHDIPGAQTLGVKCEDLVIHLGPTGLAFTDESRYEGTVPVSRRLYRSFAVLPFQAVGWIAVTAIASATAFRSIFLVS